ncbi:MAG: hypothetical protein ACRDDW_07395 [Candidatus Rhabdochlamydia sp.]
MSLSTINSLTYTAQMEDLRNKQQNYAHSERTVDALNEQVNLVVNEYRSQATLMKYCTLALAVATLFMNFLDHNPTNAEIPTSLLNLRGAMRTISVVAPGVKEFYGKVSEGKVFQINYKIERMKTRLSQLQTEANRSHIQEYLDVLTESQRRLRQQYN